MPVCAIVPQEPLCFTVYRHLQDRWILDPFHKERTKRDLGLSREPTLRELEEHFIDFEMKEFEQRYASQGITHTDYILGEIDEIRSEANHFFTGMTVCHAPTDDELASHYIESHANDTYRERFWHLVT